MDNLFTITSDGLPGSTRILAFQAVERISAPYSIVTFVLISGEDRDSLDPIAAIGQQATLNMLSEDESVRQCLTGVIASVKLLSSLDNTDALFQVIIAPKLWQLSLSEHSRVWVDKSIPDIIEDVLKKAELPSDSYELQLTGNYQPREHVCQYHESDLDFISRWMEREGIYYYFKHEDSKETLIISDDKNNQELSTTNTIHFNASAGAESAVEAMYEFGEISRGAAKDVTIRDYDYLKPQLDVSNQTSVWGQGEGSIVREGEDYTLTPTDAKRLAKVRSQEILSRQHVMSGLGRAFGLCSGFKFQLEEHPAGALNQEYLAVELVHEGSNFSGQSEVAEMLGFVSEIAYRVAVTAIPSNVQFRAGQTTEWPRVTATEIALIDGEQDNDYAQLDEHGRYLVKFKFDENDNPAGKASTRVRMLQPHGGNPEGWHLPLRKGTEVMMTFTGGDPDRPMILAAVPNSDTPSLVTSQNNTFDIFQTGGLNKLEIQDQDGAQSVYLYSPPKNSFVHLGAHHDNIKHNYVTSTDGNGLIHTGGDLNVTVGGEKTEDVDGDVKENYDQTQKTTVTGPVKETYNADMKTTVSGLAKESYNANQSTTVSASTTEKTATQTVNVSALCDESHGTQKTTIDGAYTQTNPMHLLDCSGVGVHKYGSLSVNASVATILNSGPVIINIGPLTVNVSIHLVQAPAKAETTGAKDEFEPFKLEITGIKGEAGVGSLALVGLKMEACGKATSITGVKLENMIFKSEVVGVKLQMKQLRFEGGGLRFDVSQEIIA